MSGMTWYRRNPQDFIDGIVGLGPDLIGVYAVALDLMYAAGGPIRDDPRWIGGIVGAHWRTTRALLDKLIEVGKLVRVGDRLGNPRAEKEMAAASNRSAERAESGARGGKKSAAARTVDDPLTTPCPPFEGGVTARKPPASDPQDNTEPAKINDLAEAQVKHIREIREERDRVLPQHPALPGTARPPDSAEPEPPAAAPPPPPPPPARASHDLAEDRCREALGASAPVDPVIGPIVALTSAGYDLDAEIVPALAALAKRPQRQPIRTWRLWAMKAKEHIDGIRAQRDEFAKPSATASPTTGRPALAEADPDKQRRNWAGMMRAHIAGSWSGWWGEEPGHPGCRIPPEFQAEWLAQHRSAA